MVGDDPWSTLPVDGDLATTTVNFDPVLLYGVPLLDLVILVAIFWPSEHENRTFSTNSHFHNTVTDKAPLAEHQLIQSFCVVDH